MTSWWHVIRCQSGREADCVTMLMVMGYPEGWIPTEKVERRGEKHEQRISRVKTMPGYVFLEADEVNLYEINSYEGTFWMNVFMARGEPLVLTDEHIAWMRSNPERLEKMAEQLRAQEEAERLAKLPQVGQIARIIDGIFAGNQGEVLDVGENEVTIEAQPPFKHYRVPRGLVERVA